MNPIQLVATGENGSDLTIIEDAIRLLEQEKRPVTVVSVIGPYRSGKSYLLNRLMGRNNGFPLGSTIQAKTKGIWLWIGDFFNDPDRALVLLDTEGLYDPNKDDKTHDMNLFALALLLGSVFVYNTKGAIDSSALDGLQCATAISEIIKTMGAGNADKSLDDFSKKFPFFIWTIRDHHLELQIDGRIVTPEEYLEACLKPKTKNLHSDSTIKYNGLRGAIKAFFPKRTCFAFPPPSRFSEEWNVLDTLREDQLFPKFRQSGKMFMDFVRKNAEPKTIHGKALSGRSFATLARSYIKAILAKNICIETTYDYVTQKENTTAVEEAIKAAKASLVLWQNQLPISDKQFHKVTKDVQNTAYKKFFECSFKIKKHPEYQETLKDALVDILAEFNEANNDASKIKCKEILQTIFEPLSHKIKNGDFAKPGGYISLQDAFAKVQAEYFLFSSKREEMGPMISEVLLDFTQNKVSWLLSWRVQVAVWPERPFSNQ